MIEAIVGILIFLGVFFVAVGVIGLVRFPDVYTRAHATGLLSTLGIGCVLAASLLYFNWVIDTFSIKELLIMAFLLFTCPVSTHIIIQSAYRTKVALWEKSVTDELKDSASAKDIEAGSI
ncbi:MAG: monovalent cation/H(+) antiporter subunit G [Chloroflexota bacterium]|nr:monovalent cation/H(+) antiporter subunit G [Chloroflexota bacterium]